MRDRGVGRAAAKHSGASAKFDSLREPFWSKISIPLAQERIVHTFTLQMAMATLKLPGRGELGETPIDTPGLGTEFYEMRGDQPGDDYRSVASCPTN